MGNGVMVNLKCKRNCFFLSLSFFFFFFPAFCFCFCFFFSVFAFVSVSVFGYGFWFWLLRKSFSGLPWWSWNLLSRSVDQAGLDLPVSAS